MPTHIDIRKAGGVIIRDRKLLVTRTTGKDFFITPGGKLKNDETPQLALQRELDEELQIAINAESLELLGTFYAEAAGHDGVMLEMAVYIVGDYTGELTPSSEVEEIRWVDSSTDDIEIGSIFKHDVMPLLKSRNLID